MSLLTNRQIITWLGVIFFCWLVFLLRSVLTPFLIAFGLAYIGNPIVAKVQNRFPKMSRMWAVTLVFSILVIIFLLLLLIDLYFLFDEANEEQKSEFITIIVNYYQEHQPNGLELRLCDGVARQFAVNDAFLVFEAMLANPAKELYFSDIYLGLDVLYMHYKNDKVIMLKIESMVKRLG